MRTNYFILLLAMGFSASAQSNLPPVITNQPLSLLVIAGQTATFTVGVAGPGPFTYQWLCNGVGLPNDLITTMAGDASEGYAGDGSAATNASLRKPMGVAEDSSGDLFIADAANNRIRKVNHSGIIITVAGNGSGSYAGDGGAATNASLDEPEGVAIDATGNLYIADELNFRIRKVDTNGVITTVAGNGVENYAGDGGMATNASLDVSRGVAVDSEGNLYIADVGSGRIRMVGSNGAITTVAGNGSQAYAGDGGQATNASLSYPLGVAVDSFGNMYIADTDNNRIRKVNTIGIITTVAGGGSGNLGDGGAATNARLASPTGVAVDASGNLYIADQEDSRIREVAPNGIITTVAGNGTNKYSGDGGPGTNASLDMPFGVTVDAYGNLLIGDTDNNRIRKVQLHDENPTLTLSSASSLNAGNYQVVVANAWGSVTSSVAVLAVLLPPVITQQPVSQSIFTINGVNASFSVTATGTAPLSYQWQFDGTNLTDGGNLSGSATTNLVLNSVTLGNLGAYDILITNAYGRATSSVAALTVLVPTVTSQPASQIVPLGSNCVVSVGVAGAAPLAYQWQLNGTNLPNGVNQQSSILLLTNVSVANYGDYQVIITNAYGSVTSSVAVVAAPLPLILQPPMSVHVAAGSPAGFGVTAGGAGNLSYQWQFNGVNLTDGGTVSGSATAALTLAQTTFINAGNYDVVISSAYGSVTSAVATLTVAYPPTINAQPVSLVASNGSTATLIASATGTGPLTYQWLENGNALPNNIIITVAGKYALRDTFAGDGGPATNAGLHHPNGVALDTAGNVFIADDDNDRIREVTVNGIISTVAGDGIFGFNGNDLLATNSSLAVEESGVVAVDADDNLLISDTLNERIREEFYGFLVTVAGNGTQGYSGDGGIADNAELNYPQGVDVDADGNLFIADMLNNRVRKVAADGIITTVAGNGTQGYSGDGGPATNASFYYPTAVTVDAQGNLLIADSANFRIRKVDINGIITTVAGNGVEGYSGDGGPATNASLSALTDLALDAYGDLFFADASNFRVRRVDASGVITTVAGNGSLGYSGDGGSANNASLGIPTGVAVDDSDDLFISDTYNSLIRKVTPQGPVLSLENVGLTNAGSYQLIITSPWGSVTSSVVTLTVEGPPVLSAVTGTNGSVTLNLLGQANASSEVWTTTNLTPPVIWQPIATNIPGANGLWEFTDTNASRYPVRFYRASTP